MQAGPRAVDGHEYVAALYSARPHRAALLPAQLLNTSVMCAGEGEGGRYQTLKKKIGRQINCFFEVSQG